MSNATLTMTGQEYDRVIKNARVDGIIVGLEMAEKFISMTKDKSDVEMMIRAAKAAARE